MLTTKMIIGAIIFVGAAIYIVLELMKKKPTAMSITAAQPLNAAVVPFSPATLGVSHPVDQKSEDIAKLIALMNSLDEDEDKEMLATTLAPKILLKVYKDE